MAIAAILPRDEKSEDRLVFTVVGVTVLSTIAMIIYPILGGIMALDEYTAGIYLGATIHDVAQVVGAGFSISETAGETATLVKLLRVSMLAPIVIIASLVIQRSASAGELGSSRPALIPGFVAAFVAFAFLNSFVDLPGALTVAAAATSRWLLLVAIAAVGLKTMPKDVLKVGRAAAALLVAETVFLACVIAIGLHFLNVPALPTQ